MKDLFKFSFLSLLAIAVMFSFSACSDDDDDEKEEDIAVPIADFSFAVDEENPLMVKFTNTSSDYETSSWDFGDDHTSTEVSPTHTYAESGTYKVVLTTTNAHLSDDYSRNVTVTALVDDDDDDDDDDQPASNIFAGGDMDDPEAWTVYAGAANPVQHEFREDGLFFIGDAVEEDTYQTHVWQAFEITAAGDYVFDALVQGDAVVNGYLEFVMGQEAPEDGSNYAPANSIGKGVHTGNGKVVGINYWRGCGVEPFSGSILDIACDPDGKAYNNADDPEATFGVITFDAPGTYYILIKAGNWNGSLGEGMLVKSISLFPAE